jgi:hypothetical protein
MWRLFVSGDRRRLNENRQSNRSFAMNRRSVEIHAGLGFGGIRIGLHTVDVRV